jgi:hypothetical protein
VILLELDRLSNAAEADAKRHWTGQP